jgi:hypothetical protein
MLGIFFHQLEACLGDGGENCLVLNNFFEEPNQLFAVSSLNVFLTNMTKLMAESMEGDMDGKNH